MTFVFFSMVLEAFYFLLLCIDKEMGIWGCLGVQGSAGDLSHPKSLNWQPHFTEPLGNLPGDGVPHLVGKFPKGSVKWGS